MSSRPVCLLIAPWDIATQEDSCRHTATELYLLGAGWNPVDPALCIPAALLIAGSACERSDAIARECAKDIFDSFAMGRALLAFDMYADQQCDWVDWAMARADELDLARCIAPGSATEADEYGFEFQCEARRRKLKRVGAELEARYGKSE